MSVVFSAHIARVGWSLSGTVVASPRMIGARTRPAICSSWLIQPLLQVAQTALTVVWNGLLVWRYSLDRFSHPDPAAAGWPVRPMRSSQSGSTGSLVIVPLAPQKTQAVAMPGSLHHRDPSYARARSSGSRARPTRPTTVLGGRVRVAQGSTVPFRRIPFIPVQGAPRAAARTRAQLPQPGKPLHRAGMWVAQLRPESRQLLDRVDQGVALHLWAGRDHRNGLVADGHGGRGVRPAAGRRDGGPAAPVLQRTPGAAAGRQPGADGRRRPRRWRSLGRDGRGEGDPPAARAGPTAARGRGGHPALPRGRPGTRRVRPDPADEPHPRRDPPPGPSVRAARRRNRRRRANPGGPG